MKWDEFVSLLSGLMPDTPLGAIVSIRSETDSKTIKSFSKDQKRIYNEWKVKQALAQKETEESIDALDALARALAGVN